MPIVVSADARPEAAYIEENSIPEPNSGCWLWLLGASNGYGISNIKIAKSIRAHRASWMAIHGEIPPGMVVRHKCDNPSCVNPDHLEIGSVADNNADMVARGRHVKGERLNFAILREVDVRNIRCARLEGASVTKLAAVYGVSRDNIYRIISGNTWKHMAGASDAACPDDGPGKTRKLTDQQALEVMALLKQGLSGRAIGRMFGVDHPVIRRIVARHKRPNAA